jgi:hypothetical protein
MKLQWLLRDHGHTFIKRKPTQAQLLSPSRLNRQERDPYVYQCAHCTSWISSARVWEQNEHKLVMVIRFCARSQGMLFDKNFREES